MLTFPIIYIIALMVMMIPLISSFVVVPTKTTTTTNPNSNSKKHNHQQQQQQQHCRHRRHRYYYFEPLKAAGAGAEITDVVVDDDENTNNIKNNDNDNDNLTKDELLLRLAETRQYYRDNKLKLGISDEDLCLRLLSTRLPDLQLNRCFVKQSNIPNAGNGLFASRNINDGELITLYPGDAVIIRKEQESEDGDKKKITPLITNVMFGDHIKIEDRKIDRVLTYESRGYETELNDYTSIIGDPNIDILLGGNYAYCAHYANDGAFLDDFSLEKREIYYNDTVEKYNSANFIMEEGSHVGMVATKNILKNQEIFLSYGEGYWLSRISDLKNSNTGTSGGSGSGAATTKEEAENMLNDIMSDMSERRKNVVNTKATTLMSSSTASTATMTTASSSTATGGFKKKDNKKSNNANKKKKKKTINKSNNSKGFAK
jgi:hypothetical protein